MPKRPLAERLGFERREEQIDSLNNDTRAALWNVFHLGTLSGQSQYIGDRDVWSREVENFAYIAWARFYNRMIDLRPDIEDIITLFRRTIRDEKWSRTLGFLEFWLEHFKGFRDRQDIIVEAVNHVLEQNLVNFRYVNGAFTRITDPIQETALEAVSEIKLDGIPELLRKAREHLDKRPEPDKANAIKDSAIALEQVCKLITEVDAPSIDKPLAILSKKIQLNGAIQAAIKQLYGYSCQIRGGKHGTLTAYEPSINEAILTVVLCSALATFLYEEAIRNSLIKP